MGDLFYRMQQTASVRSLELCPAVIEERLKTIDISNANLDTTYSGQRFFIKSSIVAYDKLYYDYLFLNPVNINYTITVDEVNQKTYIEFNTPIDQKYLTLYAPIAYHNPNLVRDLYGKLLNYQTVTYVYTSLEDFIYSVEVYRQQLLAILFGMRHTTSLNNVAQCIGLWLGLQYAPYDGFVNAISADSISIENLLDGTTTTITATGEIDTVNYYIGKRVSKYDILQIQHYKVYDIFSDPARFTQLLLQDSGAVLLSLLAIDINNKEKYASLFFDKNILFDSANLYWDMGNNTGVSPDPTDATVYPEVWMSLFVTNFSAYVDSRWQSQKLYEMFRNVFIVELDLSLQGNISTLKPFISILLNIIKSSKTKYLIPAPVTTPIEPYFGLVTIWDMSVYPPTKVFDAWDDLAQYYVTNVNLPFNKPPHNINWKYDFTTNMLDGSPEVLVADYLGLTDVPMTYSTSVKSDWEDWIPYGRSYVNLSAEFNS
jgi:hypothetical protein